MGLLETEVTVFVRRSKLIQVLARFTWSTYNLLSVLVIRMPSVSPSQLKNKKSNFKTGQKWAFAINNVLIMSYN